MAKKYYFAYGSNLHKQQMSCRCPSAKPVGEGRLENYGLYYRGGVKNGYLTVETRFNESRDNYVPIGIWEIDEFDEHNLDLYEGYPNFYTKRIMKIPAIIHKQDGSVFKGDVEGIIYVMNKGYPLSTPSYHYLNTCIDGYKDFDFPIMKLQEALQRSEQVLKEQRQNG